MTPRSRLAQREAGFTTEDTEFTESRSKPRPRAALWSAEVLLRSATSFGQPPENQKVRRFHRWRRGGTADVADER